MKTKIENINKAFELIKWKTAWNGRALNVFDQNEKYTGWELFDDKLEFRNGENYSVYIYLEECDIYSIEDNCISIEGKNDITDKNKIPLFVQFYNFDMKMKCD